MEVRTLELNIISAQGLKKVSTFGHDTCYAVAYVYSNDKKATGVDRDGGENPSWNSKAYSAPASVDAKQRNPKVPQVQDVPSLTGYTQTYPPVQSYPPPNWSTQGGTSTATAPYPPTANNGVSVYPPPKFEARGREDGSNAGVVVYPPPKPEGDSSSTSTASSDLKDEEPVMAYPAHPPPPQYGQDYGQQFYGAPQYYGAAYVTGPQGYYYPGAQPAYGYQQQQYQYSEPYQKYHGDRSSGSSAVGFLGAALGGLLVGDVIGNIF
ncbi:unnamed protein product [Calypogeia fissa]